MAIFALLLILAIVFFQAIQGFFSALVMAACTLAATLIAFGYYEPFAMMLMSSKPAHAEGFALMALLILPLIGLRVVLDRFLPGNVVPGMWPDRIGGGAVGVFTALLLVGTLLIGIQMMPFDRSILGYDPYDDDLQPASSIAIDAPAFTLGLVKTVSAGSFSGDEPFALRHDNLIMELWASRNRPEGAWAGAPSEAMSVLGLYNVTNVKDDRNNVFAGVPAYPTAPQATKGKSQVIVARVSVAAEGVADGDGWWRLMGTHFRLVAVDGASFYPVGYLINAGRWHAVTDKVGLVRIDRHVTGKGQQSKPKASKKKTSKSRKSKLVVDLIYRVPHGDDGKVRKLRFMTFRRHLAKGGKLPEPTEVEWLGGLASDKGGPAEALTINKTFGGKVDIEAQKGQHPFIPRRAEISRKLPIDLRLGGPVELDAKTTKEKPHFLTYLSAKDSIKTLERGPKELAGFHEPAVPPEAKEKVQWRAVQLTGRIPDTSALGKLLTGPGISMQPQVEYERVAGQTEIRAAAGAWIEWSEPTEGRKDPVYSMHLGYTADTDMLVDPSGRLNVPLGLVLQTYAKQAMSGKARIFGLVFLVPEDATILGFRLTSGGPLFTAKYPLVIIPAK